MTLLCAVRRKISQSVLSKYILIAVLLSTLTLFVLICLTKHNLHISYTSFQEFSYPSMVNFHKILELNQTENIGKLFPYQPRVIISPLSNNQSNFSVVIIVKSSVINFHKRHEIRKTWASKVCKSSHRYQVVFALGQHYDSDKSIQDKIEQESRLHKDMIQFDFIDKYDNNTFKVFAIIDYFIRSHTDVPYLAIIDDDYLLVPHILQETIMNNITKDQYPRFLGGYVWYQTKPVRDYLSKWYMPYKSYPFDYYPPYPSGGFLLISNPMVKKFHKLIPFLKYISIDDVMLGILMFKLEIYPTHLRNVYNERPQPFPKDVLACHNFSRDLLTFWNQNQYHEQCIRHHAQ